MIRKLNKSIDLKAFENRLAEELEEKTELGCYPHFCMIVDHPCPSGYTPPPIHC